MKKLRIMLSLSTLLCILASLLAVGRANGLAASDALSFERDRTERQSGETSSLDDEFDLVAYIASLPSGIALMPRGNALSWDIPGSADDDSDVFAFFLIDDGDDGMTLFYQEKDADGDSLGDPIPVRLNPSSIDDSTDDAEGTDGDEGSTDGDEESEESELVEFTLISSEGMPVMVSRTIVNRRLQASVEPLIEDIENIPEAVFIPREFLVLFSEYKKAEQDQKDAQDPIEDNEKEITTLPETKTDVNEILSPLLKELFDDGELLEYQEDGSAKVVLNIVYDSDGKAWQLHPRASTRAQAFSTEFEMVSSSKTGTSIIGIIILMVVSACSLAVNILLSIKARR